MVNKLQFSADATRQITQVAKMMALELDQDNPKHADLLECLERALFRLRKENHGQPKPGSDLAIQNSDCAGNAVLHSNDMGADMNIERLLKPEIASQLPPTCQVVTDGKGAVLVEFDGGEQVALHKLVNFKAEDGK